MFDIMTPLEWLLLTLFCVWALGGLLIASYAIGELSVLLLDAASGRSR